MPLAAASDWILTGFTALAACATVAAVIVALNLDKRQEKRLRPILKLGFDPENSRENLDLVTVGSGDALTHWVRLRISNERGRHSAEDVDVFLVRCEREDETQEISPLNERPFWWTGVVESDEKESRIVSIRIPPGVTRHLDLCFIVCDRGRAALSLCTMPQRKSRPSRLEPGVYRIELILAARDVDASRHRIRLAFDGSWSKGREFWKSIDVKLVSSPKGE